MEHYPVLLERVEEFLAIRGDGVYVDATLGAGGYAERILSRLGSGRLIAIDRDAGAIEAARARWKRDEDKVTYYVGSYSAIARALGDRGPAAGIVADLGLSRTQLTDPARGFSFQSAGPLDMRMDRSQDLTAETIVNHFDEVEIADILWRWGDERRSRRISRAIVRERPIRDTRHLAEIVERAVPRAKQQRIHPATRSFQALRIAVNDEISELEDFLEAAPPLLEIGGKMVVVSFHSHEDRAVKHAFRRWAEGKEFRILTRRVVRPSDEEVQQNAASRSAKLRAIERTAGKWLRQRSN